MRDLLYFIDSSAVHMAYNGKLEVFRNFIKPEYLKSQIKKQSSFHQFVNSHQIATIDEVLKEQMPIFKYLRMYMINDDIAGELEAFVNEYKKTINLLEQAILFPSGLEKMQKIIYRYALHETKTYHNGENCKLGTTLNTDKLLMAMTFAHAMKNGVVLVSNDKKLLRAFNNCLNNVINGTGAVEEGFFIHPIYTHSQTGDDYFFSDENMKLVYTPKKI